MPPGSLSGELRPRRGRRGRAQPLIEVLALPGGMLDGLLVCRSCCRQESLPVKHLPFTVQHLDVELGVAGAEPAISPAGDRPVVIRRLLVRIFVDPTLTGIAPI